MNKALNVLKEFVTVCGIIIGILCFATLSFWMYPTMTEVRKMDCAMAEFSPDISTEIKQLCREARSKK